MSCNENRIIFKYEAICVCSFCATIILIISDMCGVAGKATD